MISLRLYVESIAGDWVGWIEEYPAAFSQGASVQEVERSAARAFAEFLNWLRTQGEPLPDAYRDATSANFTAVAVEWLQGGVAEPWEARLFVPSDGQALGPDELERSLRLLRCSRSNLVDAAAAIPPHEWDGAPLGGRSIRSWLQRIVDVETAMLTHIGVEPTFRPHPDPLTTLERVRRVFEDGVRATAGSDPVQRFEIDGATWSVAKVLRMALWHERVCTRTIAVRSNPTAFLKSVLPVEAVVRTRDVAERLESRVAAEEAGDPALTHASASYYY
jgi:predicted RNase H-like HicB family nuclease